MSDDSDRQTTSLGSWKRREEIVEAFEAAWLAGQVPDLDEFVPADSTNRRALLADLVRVDLEFRLKSGLEARLEDYLERFPELAGELGRDELGTRTVPSVKSQPTHRPPPPSFLRPRVPGYEILDELGRGGMGVVYKAHHLKLNRTVALKMVLAGSQARPEDLLRFLAEAENIAQVRHPNIVQIHDIGQHEGLPYFAMEFLDGGTLSQRIKDAPLEAKQAARLVETLAQAIHATHQRGIIHRDLKPGNVLLQRREAAPVKQPSGVADASSTAFDGIVKITDFGLAKRLESDSGLTKTGAIMGTPSYMAPEQARGDIREIGPTTDVYALGAILYELLTGRPPFRGTSAVETLDQVLNQEAVPPSRLRPKLPRDLETICLKCLQKEQSRRYQSALELAEDLTRYLENKPILARPVSFPERVLKWYRRHPLQACLYALLVLFFFAVTVFVVVALEQELALAQKQNEVLEKKLLLEQSERERLGKGQEALALAKVAFAAGDWEKANADLEKARAVMGSEALFADLRERVDDLQKRTRDRLDGKKMHQQLKSLHDLALFHATSVTGLDRASNIQKSRATATQALALFGGIEDAGAVLAAAQFSKEQMADIHARCQELLLLLADALAEPVAREAAETQAGLAVGVMAAAARHADATGLPLTRTYYLRLASYHEQRKDKERAAEALKKAQAAAADPRGPLEYFLSGQDQLPSPYRAGDVAGAIRSFENVLRLEPDHFWAQFLTGVCYLNSRRPAEARACFNVCANRNRDLVWIYLLRGFANGELGVLVRVPGPVMDSTNFALLSGLRLYCPAAFPGEVAAAALTALRRHHDVRQREADAYLEAAEADFKKAGECSPNDDARYVLLVNRGAVRLRHRKLDEAAADLHQAIALRPNQHQAYLNLAEVYTQQDRIAKAIVEINKALAVGAKPAAAFRRRSQLYLKARPRDVDAALRDLEQAIREEQPGSVELARDHVDRAALLVQTKRHRDAVLALDSALKIQPGLAGIDRLRGHRLRAQALMELKDYSKALQSWNAYLAQAQLALSTYLGQREPVANAYRARAVLLVKMNKNAAALDDYSRALQLEKDSATYAYRGWLHVAVGSPKLGQDDFRDALELDRRNADAWNGLGLCRVLFPQSTAAIDEAIDAAERALQLQPGDSRIVYHAARIYALAARRVERLNDRRPLETLVHYEERSLELIGRALALAGDERQRFWEEYVDVDDALTLLRRHPAFLRLHAQSMQAGAKTAVP